MPQKRVGTPPSHGKRDRKSGAPSKLASPSSPRAKTTNTPKHSPRVPSTPSLSTTTAWPSSPKPPDTTKSSSTNSPKIAKLASPSAPPPRKTHAPKPPSPTPLPSDPDSANTKKPSKTTTSTQRCSLKTKPKWLSSSSLQGASTTIKRNTTWRSIASAITSKTTPNSARQLYKSPPILLSASATGIRKTKKKRSNRSRPPKTSTPANRYNNGSPKPSRPKANKRSFFFSSRTVLTIK